MYFISIFVSLFNYARFCRVTQADCSALVP